ncbi:hypothetical protein HDU93_006818, partial [Gonapodya sp. JEL0774]
MHPVAQITELCSKTFSIDSNFEFQHFFVAFILFEAGMVHVVNALKDPLQNMDPAVSGVIRSRSWAGVNLLLVALSRLMRSWTTAER